MFEHFEVGSLSKLVGQVIDNEIAKLNSLEPSSPEFNVCSGVLSWRFLPRLAVGW